VADKKYKIKVEGQEIDIPAEVGILEDPDLKRALTPMFPGAANSRIERAEKEDVVTITVIKMAGSKGGGRRSSNSKKGGRPDRPPRVCYQGPHLWIFYPFVLYN